MKSVLNFSIFSTTYTCWKNSAGRFSRVQGPGLPSYGAEYSYVQDGHRVEIVSYRTDSTATVASSTYTPLSNRNHVETVENVAGVAVISKYHYEYNDAGQRVSVENNGTAFIGSAHNLYDYNSRREVTKSERFEGDSPNPGLEILSERREYNYDPIGNRESHTAGGGSSIIYTSNNLNQYNQNGNRMNWFDDDGNLLFAISPNAESNYQYDAENRLIRVSNHHGEFVEYMYDYRGRRVGSVGEGAADPIEEYYVWDEWNLLMILDQNENVKQRFTWGLDIADQASGL